MADMDTITAAENTEAIWVNNSSKTGLQVMGDGRHFHGENMGLYVSMEVLDAAIARAERAEARVYELEGALTEILEHVKTDNGIDIIKERIIERIKEVVDAALAGEGGK